MADLNVGLDYPFSRYDIMYVCTLVSSKIVDNR